MKENIKKPSNIVAKKDFSKPLVNKEGPSLKPIKYVAEKIGFKKPKGGCGCS